jgi:hypothetical protein
MTARSSVNVKRKNKKTNKKTNLKLLDLGRILGECRPAGAAPSVSSMTGLLSLEEKCRERILISSAVGTVGK